MTSIEDDGSNSIAPQNLFIVDDNELLSLRSKSLEVIISSLSNQST
jgi:hypothetical protein